MNDLKIKSDGLYNFSLPIHFSKEGLGEFVMRFGLALVTKNKFVAIYEDGFDNRFVFRFTGGKYGVRNANYYREAPDWHAYLDPQDSKILV